MYAGLHVHSHRGSIMDGVGTPEEYAQRAVEIGMPAVAITDHGSLAAHREWSRAMRAVDVKPILGVEAYFTKDRHDKRPRKDRTDPLDMVYNHLIVLAKNDNGLRNLGRLQEAAWTDGFYQKPRIDFEVLDKYGDDLIISTACPSGLLNKAIEHDEYSVAKSHIKWFKDRFGDDFYIEVMPHNEGTANVELLQLADEYGVKPIVTPDCHHATIDQKEIQEIMLLINAKGNKVQKGHTYELSQKFDTAMEKFDYLYGEDRMMTFRNFDVHLLSYEEMKAGMEKTGVDREDIYSNTLGIADSVEDYTIEENLNLLPVSYKNPNQQLEQLARAGLKDRGLADNQEYVDRLEMELEVVKKKDFAPYFFVVRNMLNWAKKQGILVGPGRGSSAGSLLCFVLGITEIDPIKYNLLFSRFLDAGEAEYDPKFNVL